MSQSKDLSSLLGDLSQCNNEQIHLSGAIQGHGCCLFFTRDRAIQAVSANCKEFLGLHEEVLGSRLDFVFETHFVDLINQFVEKYPWRTPGVYLEYKSVKKNYDVYLFHSDGAFGLEFEEECIAESKSYEAQKSVNDNTLQAFMTDMKNSSSLRDIAQTTCRYIREISGIDRVMMYKFIPPSWHGEVIAEDRVISTHSFLHHRFPASDIPKPARDLYLKNKVRLIPDSQGKIYSIQPTNNPLTGKKWDLSDSRLRSVSPIHIEYLKNMGIRGSMSFAVTVNGELWGLIACHHLNSFNISNEKRAICSTIADIFANQAPLLEMLEGYILRSTFDTKLKKIVEGIIHGKNPFEGLFRQHHQVMEAFGATGMALIGEKHSEAAGITPPISLLKELAANLTQVMHTKNVRYLDLQNIQSVYPAWSEKIDIACGALCVMIDDKHPSLFILLRPEIVKHIVWGGDPIKNLDKKSFKGVINPRVSFESWEEVIQNESLPWASYEVDGILFLKDFVFDSIMVKNALIDELFTSLHQLKGKK